MSDQTFTQPTALSCQGRLRLVFVQWSECLRKGNRPKAGYVCAALIHVTVTYKILHGVSAFLPREHALHREAQVAEM